ncbi:hypothetical protein G6R29_00625 [Fructobacillus sp. M2-14]|uniref:Integral membrane protein n=1 Tax=Fructobacillus broussonetiae TaxID=2713173 RepID=A0ABS5R1U5_9LACO|nr:hypothetical protein [Fructobacillus broussonetiae]MBS9338142.1 hypothetical protein [Fructobacillus broussonetiae]
MTTEELIEQNNELRAALNKENEDFYLDFLLYVRSQGVLKDEQTVEEQLFAILQDILEAQKNGQSAADYFGTDPKFVADRILQQTPNKLSEAAKLFLYGFGAYIGFSLLPSLPIPGKPMDLGSFLLSGVYLTLLAIVGFFLIGKTIYFFKKSKMASWMKSLMSFVIACAVLFPAFAITFWLHTPAQINLDGTLGIFVIVLVLIGVTVFIKKQEKKDKDDDKDHIWRPILFFVILSAVVGVLTRLPILDGLLLSKGGRLILAGIMLAGLVIFNVYTVYTAKKMNKED